MHRGCQVKLTSLALVNKLVPCSWVSAGALEAWSLPRYYTF